MRTSLRLFALLSLLLASPAHAAEGGLLSPSGGLMVWTILIFGIVLFVLGKFAYPHLLGAVEAREAHIRELLAAAARDREEAQALLAEQRQERENLRTQVQEMLAEGRAAGERVREEILAEARREQEAILERTRRDVQVEMERAVAELRVQAVDVAIAAASRLLERNLDQADNRRLVQEYLERVELTDAAPATAGV